MKKHVGLSSIKINKLFVIAFAVLIMVGLFSVGPKQIKPFTGMASAACLSTAPPTTYGKVTQSVNVVTAGTYRVWSRIKAPDTTNNSYYFQVDGGCAYDIGDSTSIPANTWTWVNYQDGTASSAVSVTLTAGTHTLSYTGKEPNVELDKVMLLTDTSCVPTTFGDNCATTDTTSPTVALTAPASGATVSGVTTLTATAADASGVTKVEFYVDGNLVSTDTSAAYSFAWNTTTVSNATHTLLAKAYDPSGNVGSSSAVTVTVKNVVAPPVAGAINDTVTGTGLGQFNYSGAWSTDTTTAPNAYQANNHYTNASGAFYQVQFSGTQIKVYTQKGGDVGISGISIDGGAEALVDEYAANRQDQVLVYTSPVLTNGTHALKVRNTGTKNGASSGTYLIADRVDTSTSGGGPDTTPPTTAITAPTNGSTVNFSDAIVPDNLKVTASDNIGVTKVEAYDGTTLIGTDTTAPYSFTWTTTKAGVHALTSKAYDAAGNSSISAVVSVTATIQPLPGGKPGDVNGDGRVNALDLSALLSHDGQNYPPADFNHNGTVDAADYAILLANWTW